MRDKSLMEEAVRSILSGIGEDIEREGLLDTPARVARMFLEMSKGLRQEPPKVTTFSANGDSQMVTVLDIDYHSLCEHHLVPFYGQAHIGYLAGKKLAGLSKFARVVDHFAARPQIQEVMTDQIASYLQEILKPRGLIVVVEGHHMCMSARGVKKQNHVTVTSALRGDIPKEEFFDILKSRR
jgi:GTP cyclohydrolase I